MPSLTRSVHILLTASEAYPALELAFLGALREIWAGFPVFDLTTRLRPPEALAIGKTSFDLVVHILNRDVPLHVSVSDVDPIAWARKCTAATGQMRMFSAAVAAANPGVKLAVRRASSGRDGCSGPCCDLALHHGEGVPNLGLAEWAER